MDIKRITLWVIFVISTTILFDNYLHKNKINNIETQKNIKNEIIINKKKLLQDEYTENNIRELNKLKSKYIKFSTNVYEGKIDTKGGKISFLSIFKEKNGKKKKFINLFNDENNYTYIAKIGLINKNLPDYNEIYSHISTKINKEKKTFDINLVSHPNKENIKIIKTFRFTKDSYIIDVIIKIINEGYKIIHPSIYMEIIRDDSLAESPKFSNTFTGPAIYTPKNKFQKISFKDIDKNKQHYTLSIKNGWIAMIQHYFASAWIPEKDVNYNLYIKKIDKKLYQIGLKNQLNGINPNKTLTISSRLFAGPQEERILENIAPGLSLIKDYGWATIIAKPLFFILEKIHNVIGNWGWSIVILMFIIKIFFFPLSAASYKSMSKMKKIAPRMQALREQFKDDQQKMNAALVELYKKEKVNPFGGCLPVLIQIPVFISLYWVLLVSVEICGAPWILWIKDLSKQDPYFILPICMTISMFIQTKLNPSVNDPIQAKIITFIPIIFSIIFFFFPAGLVLYYVVNNILSIIQQWYISKTFLIKKY